ncbi:MAG: hypothetical protein PQJ46_09390 [Spirochaetales bacterium]|nr:hypothetical protein [Spirochaetales bacterium]
MGLEAQTQIEMLGPTHRIPGKLTAGDTYYKGGVMGIIDGFFSASGGIPSGILTGYGFDPDDGGAKVVSSSDNPDAEIDVGMAWVPYSGASQESVGDTFFLTDDNTVTTTAGDYAGVLCRGYKSGYVLLDFRTVLAS